MKVLSTNTGVPQTYSFEGATIQTSMRRSPQPFGIQVTTNRVVGDQFTSPNAHGGLDAVVYALSADSFEEWSDRLEQPIGSGCFGENLTLDSLDEKSIRLGDEFLVGDVCLKATGPRYPCSRLNFSFQRSDAQIQFLNFRRPGVYFKVISEGHIRVGDRLLLSKKSESRFSIIDVYDALRMAKFDLEMKPEFLSELIADSCLPEMYRSRLRTRLDAGLDN